MNASLERLLRAALLATIPLLAGACAAGSGQLVPMPSQDSPLSDPAKCRVYVLRESQPIGRARVMRVHDQQFEIGTVSGGEYLCWERPPGRGLVRLQYEGPAIDRGELETQFDLHAEAGRVYYLSASLRTTSELSAMSMTNQKRGSPVLQLLDEGHGRALVEKSDPVKVR